MLRAAAGRIVGVGGGIAGPVQQQQQQAACSACKTSRKFSMAKAAARYACTCQREGGGSVILPVSTAPQTTLNCSRESLNEWEFSEEETNRDNLEHHQFRHRVVFGAAPTKEEVEKAVSDLEASLTQSIFYPSSSRIMKVYHCQLRYRRMVAQLKFQSAQTANENPLNLWLIG